MSDQHPRAKAKHIDEGPWTVQDTDMGYEIWSKKGWLVAQELNEPHAELFREAGNVANRTGHTPEEMAGLLRECLDIVAEKYDNLSTHEAYKYGDYYRDLLKKLEAFR